jgi:hypothetical protein
MNNVGRATLAYPDITRRRTVQRRQEAGNPCSLGAVNCSYKHPSTMSVAPSSAYAPGRTCPLSYRYEPSVFSRPAELNAQTLYVAGGLYGNIDALDAIQAMFAAEPGIAGRDKLLVFNGDFHWFDAQEHLFAQIDARVNAHIALRGNVETEIAQAGGGADCGCAYPQDVDEGTVARSNFIITRLREVAQRDAARCARMAALPMHAVAQVGPARVAIVHGDAQSLAGWQFDPCALDDPAALTWLRTVFQQAAVDIFASSHTCASALRVFAGLGAIINNGAAGMSSVPGTAHGVLTRIGVAPVPHSLPVLASARVAGVHVQALTLEFNAVAWQRRFLALWPKDSAAHTSYWRRIVQGPSVSTLHATVDHHSRAQ